MFKDIETKQVRKIFNKYAALTIYTKTNTIVGQLFVKLCINRQFPMKYLAADNYIQA